LYWNKSIRKVEKYDVMVLKVNLFLYRFLDTYIMMIFFNAKKIKIKWLKKLLFLSCVDTLSV